MGDANNQPDLDAMRRDIDAADDEIVASLAKRFAVCEQIAEYKRVHGLPITQPSRVVEVKARVARLSTSLGLAPDVALAIYDVIIDEASRLEKEHNHDGGPAQ
jgi:4-amino-4-deoxychorismate mutase